MSTLMVVHNAHVSILVVRLTDEPYVVTAVDEGHLDTAMALTAHALPTLANITYARDPALLVLLRQAYLDYTAGFAAAGPIIRGTAKNTMDALIAAMGPFASGKKELDEAIDHANLLEAAGTLDCSRASDPTAVPIAAAISPASTTGAAGVSTLADANHVRVAVTDLGAQVAVLKNLPKGDVNLPRVRQIFQGYEDWGHAENAWNQSNVTSAWTVACPALLDYVPSVAAVDLYAGRVLGAMPFELAGDDDALIAAINKILGAMPKLQAC